MEKELFLKGMQELLEVAKAGGDKIRKEDILSYFGGMDITDEIETMLCRWRGMKKARKRNYRKKRQIRE